MNKRLLSVMIYVVFGVPMFSLAKSYPLVCDTPKSILYKSNLDLEKLWKELDEPLTKSINENKKQKSIDSNLSNSISTSSKKVMDTIQTKKKSGKDKKVLTINQDSNSNKSVIKIDSVSKQPNMGSMSIYIENDKKDSASFQSNKILNKKIKQNVELNVSKKDSLSNIVNNSISKSQLKSMSPDVDTSNHNFAKTIKEDKKRILNESNKKYTPKIDSSSGDKILKATIFVNNIDTALKSKKESVNKPKSKLIVDSSKVSIKTQSKILIEPKKYKDSLVSNTVDTLKIESSSDKKGQFEGVVHYTMQLLNPNKKLISDEEFYRDIPGGGISKVKLYIKGNLYKWEYEDKIEWFDPVWQKLCTRWIKKDKDTYHCIATTEIESQESSISQVQQTVNVLNHSCKGIQFKNLYGYRTYYYSPNNYPLNGNNWKQHMHRDWGPFVMTAQKLPLKIEVRNIKEHFSLTATKIESKVLLDSDFVNTKKVNTKK